MLHVTTTLTKQFPSGVTSTWKFGQLDNGWFACKCLENGKKLYFNSLQSMDRCIHNYMHRYGYQNRAATLIRQLSLAV